MKSILVIEDNLEVRENICEILELSGYDVYSAENGAVGVEQSVANKPDLILCDVMMPRLDGYGVLKIVRSNPVTSHIPFIFLTARAEKSDFRKGMGLGADDFITKPFDDTELLSAIETRLARQDKTELTFADPNKTWHQEAVIKSWIEEIKAKSPKKLIRAKESFYREGDSSRYVFILAKGIARELTYTEDGKALITQFYGAEDILGAEEVVLNTTRRVTVESITDTEAFAILADQFIDDLASNRQLSRFFIQALADKISANRANMTMHAYSSVRKKVAEALLRCHTYILKSEPSFPSREDLSLMAGVAKETLIRTLSQFKSEGLIDINGKHIIITDKDGLKTLPQ